MRKKLLALTIASLSGVASAQNTQTAPGSDTESPRHYTEAEEIIVRALPFQRSRLETTQPVDLLVGESLDDQRGMTLGETLQQQPGVHSSAYGAGAGRPVIRGLGGHRVLILEDGLSSGDTSAQSDDHAVTADPLLIERIEILRGPATLLYGSRAAGGVINLIDGRIPESRAETPVGGSFEVRGDTVADERSGVLRLDGGSGRVAWHLDGSWRDADDYDIPGQARTEDAEGEHHDEEAHHHEGEAGHEAEHDDGELFNSFVESRAATAGMSWIADRGFIGASVREYRSEYGIPAPHFHAEEEAGHEEEHGHEEEEHAGEEHGEEAYAFIDMEQRSWDIKGRLRNPLPGLTDARLRLRYSDYTHAERELAHHDGHEEVHEEGHETGHDEGHGHGAGTVFDVQTWQGRLEMETRPVAGWNGAFGLQFDEEDYVAAGAEAFVPDTHSWSAGLFALQERRFGDLTLSAGARVERNRIELSAHSEEHHEEHHEEHEDHADEAHAVSDVDSRSFTNVSASLGGIYRFNDQWQAALNFQHSQRAPSKTELFANGPHLATFTFEEGNPALGKERTNAWDLKFHRHSDVFDFEANLFYNAIDDFIYLAGTEEEHDGFPVREATQQDAHFHGLELQGVWQVFTGDYGHFDLRANYDRVRGSLDDGGNLPRISPERLGGALDWHLDRWRGSVDVYRVMRHDHTAPFESETPGYNMINAQLAYEFDINGLQLEAFLHGRNLGDEEARVATSFLKDFAPLPGRNFVLGLRGSF